MGVPNIPPHPPEQVAEKPKDAATETAEMMDKDAIEQHQRDTALLLNQLWDSLSQNPGGKLSPSHRSPQGSPMHGRSGGYWGGRSANLSMSPTSCSAIL